MSCVFWAAVVGGQMSVLSKVRACGPVTSVEDGGEG